MVWKLLYNMILNEKGVGIDTVTKPWGASLESQGNRTLGKQLGCPRKWFWGGGEQKARWSIIQASQVRPRAPKVPVLPWQREGPEKRHVARRDGSVPAMGLGEERRGSAAFLALQRCGLRSSETRAGQPIGGQVTSTGALSTLQPQHTRVSPRCAPAIHKQNYNTREKQFISLREKRSIHHSIYNTAKMSCQNKHTKILWTEKYKKMTKLGVFMGYRHCLKHLSVPGKSKLKNIPKKFKKSCTPRNLVLVTGEGRGVGREENRCSLLLASVSWALVTPACVWLPDREAHVPRWQSP